MLEFYTIQCKPSKLVRIISYNVGLNIVQIQIYGEEGIYWSIELIERE